MERDFIFRSSVSWGLKPLYHLMDIGCLLRLWDYYDANVGLSSTPPSLSLLLDSLKDIGNKLGHYLDELESKEGQFSCDRIHVEVNLNEDLSEALKINLREWRHI